MQQVKRHSIERFLIAGDEILELSSAEGHDLLFQRIISCVFYRPAKRGRSIKDQR